MLDDDGNIVIVSAHELSAQMNFSHRAIIPHNNQRNAFAGPRPVKDRLTGRNEGAVRFAQYAVFMQIRESTLGDLGHVSAVCNASGRTRWTGEMIAPRIDRVVLVAVTQGEVAGVAKTHLHPNPDGSAPAGHYLGGVVVAPGFRRGGVGSALTRARLEWIWSRASFAYYFTNEHNTASIKMHETLGFRPVARFSEIRGVTADDGRSELILFEASA